MSKPTVFIFNDAVFEGSSEFVTLIRGEIFRLHAVDHTNGGISEVWFTDMSWGLGKGQLRLV